MIDKKEQYYIYDRITQHAIPQHEPDCLVARAKLDFEVYAFTSKYPKACNHCGGAGLIEYQDDPSPAGVSLSPGYITYTDPCECVENGTCPLCGEQSLIDKPLPDDRLWDGETICTGCEYDSELADEGKSPVFPFEYHWYMCYCIEQHYEKQDFPMLF